MNIFWGLHQFSLAKEHTEWAENEKENEKKGTTECGAGCEVEGEGNESEGLVENGRNRAPGQGTKETKNHRGSRE